MKKSPKSKKTSRSVIADTAETSVMRSSDLSQPSNIKSSFLIVALIVISFFAGYLLSRVQSLEEKVKNETTQQAQQGIQPQKVEVKIDQVKKLFTNGYMKFGDANRKVLFVEVSDPSCPYCHIAGGLNPEIASSAGDRFKYVSQGGVYVPPVTEMKKLVDEEKASFVMLYANGHGNGRLGAQAMYCAYEQNKFWEVHDLLMSNQGYELINNQVKNDKANIPTLTNFLASVANTQSLQSCLESGKYEKTLDRDQQLAQTIGFQGTPHFLVNTTQYGGAYSWTDMEGVVKSAL